MKKFVNEKKIKKKQVDAFKGKTTINHLQKRNNLIDHGEQFYL